MLNKIDPQVMVKANDLRKFKHKTLSLISVYLNISSNVFVCNCQMGQHELMMTQVQCWFKSGGCLLLLVRTLSAHLAILGFPMGGAY